MANELLTVGVQFQIGDGASPEAFTAVANVKSITGNGSGGARSDIDVTNLDSTAREYLTGLRDIEEVTFDINQIVSDATHQLLETLHASGAQRNMRLLVPASPVFYYSGSASVKNVAATYEVDQVIMQSVTIRPRTAFTRGAS